MVVNKNLSCRIFSTSLQLPAIPTSEFVPDFKALADDLPEGEAVKGYS